MNRNHALIIAILFGFIAVSFMYHKATNVEEPSFQGKTLSQWTDQWRTNRFSPNSWTTEGKTAIEDATFAMAQIGTNGIPFLLKCMRAREAPLVARLRRIAPSSWHKRLGLDASERNARTLNALGSFGIAALGSNAAPALESMLEIISNEKPGPDSVYRTIWALKYLGPKAEPAIPLLIQCLRDRDSSVRDETATTLGFIGRRYDLVVPSLISFLEWRKGGNGNAESISAIQSLSILGTNALEAAPTILGLLNDPDVWIRTAATNCIRRINPAAASRVGITP